MINTAAQECWVATVTSRFCPGPLRAGRDGESVNPAKMKLCPGCHDHFASKQTIFYLQMSALVPRQSHFSIFRKGQPVERSGEVRWRNFQIFKCGAKIFKRHWPVGDDWRSPLEDQEFPL